MTNKIKVIDIFSGPGGLGEGFSAYQDASGNHPFKIAISIEKEESAHKTLKLRSFFRQFNNDAPKEYYDFLKGKLGAKPEDELYKNPKFAKQLKDAENEALCLELGKDNRTINKSIEAALGNDECVLIGGPPCQAYSLAGRSRNKGIENYKAENDHRNFLYKEYLKIIAQFQPAVFVMENVKGMLSAKVNGHSIYEIIFNDLHNPCRATNVKPKRGFAKHQYKIVSLVTEREESRKLDPKEFIIKSERYGIPQRRHRVILLGIREDLSKNWKGELLNKHGSDVELSSVISDLPKLRSGLSKIENSDNNWIETITEDSKSTIQSLLKCGLPDVAKEVRMSIKKMKVPEAKQGMNLGLTRNSELKNKIFKDWYYDIRLGKYICNHITRGHISQDLQRYLFCSSWGAIATRNKWSNFSPKSKDYPNSLIPAHKNFKSGKFADRFRVQPWNIPATTITSHISKDGHYYIHPDPHQCRSLTVREAARIQTFPDNYFFCGNRTQQYVQVGNAVPPILAHQIAMTLAARL